MVWKTGKFGLNIGSTQRQTPFLTYGQGKCSSITRKGHDTEGALEKLQECLDNSPNMDPFTKELFLQGVQNIIGLLEPDQEYSLDKQNRWEFVNIIEEQLLNLKEMEEEIQNNLGGENPPSHYELDAEYCPTELEINLEIYNLDQTNVSKLSFCSVKRRDFVSDLDGEIKQRKNWLGYAARGIQRRDQVQRTVVNAP